MKPKVILFLATLIAAACVAKAELVVIHGQNDDLYLVETSKILFVKGSVGSREKMTEIVFLDPSPTAKSGQIYLTIPVPVKSVLDQLGYLKSPNVENSPDSSAKSK